MGVQRQVVCSTKSVKLARALRAEENNNKHDKRHDILILSYDMKKTIYMY